MKAIVAGMIATYPVPGMAWDYIQYVIGMTSLGCEVVYLEDTGLDSYHPDPSQYLCNCLKLLTTFKAIRWHYRAPVGAKTGISMEELALDLAEADMFINGSRGTLPREEYMVCSNKILIDTDPGHNQLVNYPKWDLEPGYENSFGYRGHDHFFTYASCIGENGCLIPTLGINWKNTLPPVSLERWSPKGPGTIWTTVMSWKPYEHYSGPSLPAGINIGAKEIEFPRFENLAKLCSSSLQLAVGGKGAPVEKWERIGWRIAGADQVTGDINSCRDYICSSRGEFSVAKHIYVSTHSGWFSTRSVCYFAASRPVVVQDTGFRKSIPTGHGILAFTTMDEAIEALNSLEADYADHQEAASAHARSIFSAEKVLSKLLSDIGL